MIVIAANIYIPPDHRHTCMRLTRRQLALTAASVSIPAALAGCLSGGDENGDDDDDDDTGTGDTDADDTTDDTGTDDGQDDDDTGDEGDEDDSGPSAPDDMLEAHAQALQAAGSFTADMDVRRDVFSEPDDDEPRLANPDSFYVEYVYDDDIGLHEEVDAEEFDGETSEMVTGTYRTTDTAYTKGPTGTVEEDASASIEYGYAEDIEFPVRNAYHFSDVLDEYSEVGGANHNGEAVTEYSASGHEDFEEFESTLYVNDEGVVVYVEFENAWESGQDWIETSGTIEFTDIGETEITVPEWYAEYESQQDD